MSSGRYAASTDVSTDRDSAEFEHLEGIRRGRW